MTTDVETVDSTASLGQVAKRFEADGHSAYPVVDGQGRCVAIVSRSDLLRQPDFSDESPVGDLAAGDVVSVASSDPLSEALEKMLAEEIHHLPVIDGDNLVGICTRTDVIRAREAQREHEQLESGWRSPRGRNVPSTNGNNPSSERSEEGEER
jgi:CBS domain-containing protein